MPWIRTITTRVIAIVAMSVTSIHATCDEGMITSASRCRIVAHRGASTDRPECTLSALQRAIDLRVDVVEIDVRTSKDGVLFLLHDATLDRTTDGTGPANQHTIATLQKLDAGSWFGKAYSEERIPTLTEALKLCRGKIDVLLDLKEQGTRYAEAVAREVHTHGEPRRTIVGVRSVEQARLFRTLQPDSKQLGLIANPKDIESYAMVGVETIRLWPAWLDTSGPSLRERVRASGAQLHLNGKTGTPHEVLPLLMHRPDMLLADDVATLQKTIATLNRHRKILTAICSRSTSHSKTTVVPWISGYRESTFLNRDYHMLELPDQLKNQARFMFAGGDGDQVEMSFETPTVVFAAFEYNSTGAWSFPEQHEPQSLGWRVVTKSMYRGSSNGTVDGKAHYASIYCKMFKPGERLEAMPPWWLCLAVVAPEDAAMVPGFTEAMSRSIPASQSPFLYSQWATRSPGLQAPEFKSIQNWRQWQERTREDFRDRLVFQFSGQVSIRQSGEAVNQGDFAFQEFHVELDHRRLFRFFHLTPKPHAAKDVVGRPTIVVFMGHGKVSQVLLQEDSYQHACAAKFAAKGYEVFAMENVGMEPNRDTHHELDRLLRLHGYGWYSLLFAHQQILLDHVFAHQNVDAKRVGVAGVSTGGLLALSAIALDNRVAAASVQGIFGSMRVSFIRDRNRHCACGGIPGLLPRFDLPELALLASPRALHISNATNDGFSPAEAERCLDLITPLYVQSGGVRPVFTQPEGRHEFSFQPALKFFESTIGKP